MNSRDVKRNKPPLKHTVQGSLRSLWPCNKENALSLVRLLWIDKSGKSWQYRGALEGAEALLAWLCQSRRLACYKKQTRAQST